MRHPRERRLPGFPVDRHANVHLGPVANLCGTRERLFHRLHDQRRVDHLLARNSFRRLQKFKLVAEVMAI